MELLTRKSPTYDAVIVGSGASGGMAAKELTTRGFRVLVLEAGPPVDPNYDFNMHSFPYDMMYRGLDAPHRKAREQWMQDTASEYSRKFYVNDTEHPYTSDPGKPFMWVRARIVGGKTLHWGRLSWRLSDLELKAASRDGFDVDWPVGYTDLAPYYDRVEEFIGVSGSREGIPHLPDGKFLPAFPMTCGEQLLRKGVEKTGRKAIPSRVAMLTSDPQPHMRGRSKCHFCGNCNKGCDVGAMFNSVVSTLPVAERTGRLTLRPNSVVRHVIMDPITGRAKGVSFLDRLSHEEHEALGRVVILAASTLESTRLLLNSRAPRHPEGLGNSSGTLGHYLMDHLGGLGASGVFPGLLGREAPDGEDGKASGIYVPRFRNLDEATRHTKFIRGYGFECGAATGMSIGGGGRRIEGFGEELKRAIRRQHAATVSIVLRGEMLPRFENYVELDPGGVVDAWGIPVLRIHVQHSDNERQMAKDAMEACMEMLEAAGAESISPSKDLAAPGRTIHELGTARMGEDPKRSVTNAFGQVHDVRNLFVADGAAFTSSGYVNPTLTILALTARACDGIAERLKSGDV